MDDAAGHKHFCGDSDDPFPTLTRVHDGWAEQSEEPDDNSEIEYYHLACAACGEKIWPSPSGPPTDVLPGVFLYWIGDETATRREALDFVGLIRAGDPERWDRLSFWLKYQAGLAPVKPRVTRD
jgi:hypothetical protein